MILPVLLPRMEQGRRFLCERVDGSNGVRLELVACPARQADVIEGRQSAARCRRDVVIRQRGAAHRFAREAVAARPSISGIDLRAQRLRNPGRHDLGNQLWDGYLVTAPAQEDGGVRLDEHEPIGLAPEHLQLGAPRIAERSGCTLLEQLVVSHHFGLRPAAPR